MNSSWINYADYIVGIPAIIVGAILTLWIYYRQKSKKGISYRIITQENLLSYKEEIEDKLEVFFNKNKISSLSILVIEFQNNGNIPIQKSDFDNVLKISFKSVILSSEIIYKNPKDLEVTIQISEDQVEFSKFLFNPKDKFSVKFLLNTKDLGFTNENITCRIVGLKKIEEARPIKLGFGFYFILGLTLLCIAYSLGYFFLSDTFFIKTNSIFQILSSLLVLTIFLAVLQNLSKYLK